MNSRPKLFGLYMPIFLILAAVSATLRSIAAVYYLDAYGYYSNKLLFNVSAIIVAAGVAFLATYIIFERKDIKLIPSFASPASYAPAAVVAVALLLIGVYMFELSFDVYEKNTTMRLITLANGILALASACYFTVSTFIIRRRSMKRADLGIIVLVFICAYVAYLYFSTTLPINAPNKVIDQMAYLGAALFFLYETRLSLGREKWRAYIACGFIAALLLAYSSIPSLVLYFGRGRIMSDSIYETALSFALLLFTLSKLLLTTVLVEDKESPVVTKIIEASKKRSEEIALLNKDTDALAAESTESGDENQISITDMEYTSNGEGDDGEKLSIDTASAIESMSLTEDVATPDTFTESDDTAEGEEGEVSE